MTRPAPAPVAPAWERANSLLAVDRDRILAFAREQRERGAVVVDLDAGPGAPLAWLPYDPSRLRAIGSHWNAGLGVALRHPDFAAYLPLVFLSGGRIATHWFVSAEHTV